ncbi:septum site-determining protein MinC [Thalassobacillus pellis]|uniref:septum site-determining protein MinC n=1 Tax=Thalassobacillus pellis TaxID=748008 RepID=UPI001961114C|nr:septum site-determining protein MinC [Thalassobacillus pellis]MBM7554620.1 septum site-determining protein MinC [Thalassobacillus pellis]
MIASKQKIAIKGTRHGLTLQLDDQCSYKEILGELDEKLSSNNQAEDDQLINVTIQLGNRYLTQEQKDALKKVIREKQHLVVDSIESNLITKEEAKEWKKHAEVKPFVKVVRSGQVINIEGDLLLIGDVNPGGKVMATGNIFIMGSLRGIAHAGVDGDEKAVISASFMKPSQLRISDSISQAPDYETDGVYMECAYLDEKVSKILMERLQDVIKKRPDLSSFERRMLNG